jgi:hypothetical protein
MFAFRSVGRAIPWVLQGKRSKLDFFVRLIGGFVSGLQGIMTKPLSSKFGLRLRFVS